jgi:ubiquinone/menaquinone biosynthesis C-methylase UbiE
MSPELHPSAAVGFERASGAYERGRPDYPADAVIHVVEHLGIGPGRRVLDLAAGTGKLTRALVATGADVVAVEPVSAMRATLASGLPTVHAVAGTAEALPLADGSVDAATVAQAFHWFDASAAIDELHRVLRDRGRLCLIWNVRDGTDPLQASLSALIAPYRAATPSHGGERWRKAFEQTDRFTMPELATFRHEQRLDVERLVDRVVSVSFIAVLDDDERAALASRVRALAPPGGEVVLPYRTDVWTTERRR